MLTILNGGKEVGSKVKFSKFYLLIEITIGDILKAEQEVKDENEGTPANKLAKELKDPFNIYNKINNHIKKTLSSSKAGIGAFKRSTLDGSYFNATENINESFKLIEDAIN